MNIKSIIAASALALASAAHSADVVVQTNDPASAEMDEVVKKAIVKRLVPALDKAHPRNNYVILVSYNIGVEGGLCVFSVSLTGAFKDKQGNAVVINKLSPTENAIGGTVGQNEDVCADRFHEAVDTASYSIFQQFQKLNMKRV